MFVIVLPGNYCGEMPVQVVGGPTTFKGGIFIENSAPGGRGGRERFDCFQEVEYRSTIFSITERGSRRGNGKAVMVVDLGKRREGGSNREAKGVNWR
jgi:hypothetical protein